MLLDTATLAWSDDLCALFGVPAHTLPEVRPSAGRFGTTQLPDLGAASAVLDGLPIAGVLGDQQAALFGQCCFDPGMVKVTYGTGSFVLANAGPVRPAAPDGLTVSVAWDLGPHAGGQRGRGAGTARRWPMRSRGRPSSRAPPSSGCATASGSSTTRRRPARLAESVGDSGGVTFVPALTGLGSPWWDPAARGIITGLTRGAGRAQIVRACIEAIAFQVRDMTDAMRAASAYPLSSLRADGGAAAMDLLLRLQAEQSRMPVARPRVDRVHRTGRGHAGRSGRRGVGIAGRAERSVERIEPVRARVARRVTRCALRRLAPGGRPRTGLGRGGSGP